MNPRLYKAAMEGDHKFLSSENHEFLSCVTRSHKDNAVHIAARFGHEYLASIFWHEYRASRFSLVENACKALRFWLAEKALRVCPSLRFHGHELFVEKALRFCPSLRFQQNESGDTPLHVAARAGHVGIVELLIGKPLLGEDGEAGPSRRRSMRQVEEGEDGSKLLRMKNRENDTALHEALRNFHEDVALFLLRADSGLASLVNNSKESPLFLAAESGFITVLEEIFSHGPQFIGDGPYKRTPLHVAALTKCSGCTEILIRNMPEAINGVDEFGKTALHYAVAKNSTEIIRLLLEKDILSAYVADNDGNSPLLIAAISGYSQAAKAILDYCPEAIEQVDKSGRNALHLAVNKIKNEEVQMLLNLPILRQLLNKPDNDGNTPLHLATKRHHYLMVKGLVGTKCVDLRARNKDGLTVLDICESEWKLSYRQKHLWEFLTNHKASRGGGHFPKKVPFSPRLHPEADLKQMANTFSVVAALLATLTFTAAFTIPGGYSEDGHAILAKKASFKAFMLFDTVAMCCSMTMLFLLIWAMVGDHDFLIQAIHFSINLYGISFFATLAAFTTGIYTVLSTDLLWLCIIVIILGSSVPMLVYILYTLASTRLFPRFLSPMRLFPRFLRAKREKFPVDDD